MAASSAQDEGIDLLPTIRDGLAAKGAIDDWRDSAAALAAALGVQDEDAELVLARAYGWKAWAELGCAAYLRPKLPPSPTEIRAALDWLAQGPLTLSAKEIRAAVEDSPKLYLKEPAKLYEDALKAAPEPFAGAEAFGALVRREPGALGLTWNCELTDPETRVLDAWGEPIHCDGKCTHCWRTSKPRFLGKVLDGVEV